MEEKKENPKKIIAILIFIILLLSFFTYLDFKKFGESLKNVQLPKFEIPGFEFSPPKTEGYKEFTSPDGKLKMRYPADWTVMDSQLIESTQSQVTVKGKVLFLAQKFSWEETAISFLSVQELNLETGKSAEEIIEALKEESKKRGGEMEVIKLEIKDKELFFEAKYKREGNLDLHSEEKVILTEGKNYLVSFFTLEKDWSKSQKEGEDILSTVQYIA